MAMDTGEDDQEEARPPRLSRDMATRRIAEVRESIGGSGRDRRRRQ